MYGTIIMTIRKISFDGILVKKIDKDNETYQVLIFTLPVKNAYYFVFLNQNLLVQGSIGQNVSAFQTVHTTTGFINGKNYTVRVSDQPFLNPPLTNPNIPETRYLPIPGTTTTGSRP